MILLKIFLRPDLDLDLGSGVKFEWDICLGFDLDYKVETQCVLPDMGEDLFAQMGQFRLLRWSKLRMKWCLQRNYL